MPLMGRLSDIAKIQNKPFLKYRPQQRRKIMPKILDYFLGVFKESVTPVLMTKIVQGAKAVEAATDLYHEGTLFAPPINLAPEHVNCVRIAFFNTPARMETVEYRVNQYYDTYLLDDSYVEYGFEGTVITVN